MGKRGHGEGSIYKREDGLWVCVIDLGIVSGKRKRKYLYGDTRKEVSEKLKIALRAQQQGLPIALERQTVEHFLQTWLSDSARPKTRATTYRGYEIVVRRHLIPEIGHIQLAKLTGQDVQRLINLKMQSDLSPRMVQYIHAVLHIALGRAQKWGYVVQNVAELVDVPSVPHFEPEFLSVEDARALLHAIQGHRLQALFTVALALGLRKGEALGLRWKSVDFDKQQLVVQTNLQFIEGKFQILETKSHAGRRSISLPDVALKALIQHKEQQGIEREAAKEDWQEWGLVFTTSRGTPFHASNINRMFNQILKKAGMFHLRFHDLRHTCASLLIAQGVHPRMIMEILGHSQISLTMNTYGHIIPGLKGEVADKMQELLGDDE